MAETVETFQEGPRPQNRFRGGPGAGDRPEIAAEANEDEKRVGDDEPPLQIRGEEPADELGWGKVRVEAKAVLLERVHGLAGYEAEEERRSAHGAVSPFPPDNDPA